MKKRKNRSSTSAFWTKIISLKLFQQSNIYSKGQPVLSSLCPVTTSPQENTSSLNPPISSFNISKKPQKAAKSFLKTPVSLITLKKKWKPKPTPKIRSSSSKIAIFNLKKSASSTKNSLYQAKMDNPPVKKPLS